MYFFRNHLQSNILLQALPLYIQTHKIKKSRSTRDFIFCLLGIIPQTPRTKISSSSHTPVGTISPYYESSRFFRFYPAQCRVYIHNSACAEAFLWLLFEVWYMRHSHLFSQTEVWHTRYLQQLVEAIDLI